MTILATEIQKWKRNKIVWCILGLTLLFGAFAIERACSIARSSPYMDSFGDLYTLAFKNLSSLFLPVVLGMFATTLFFDERKKALRDHRAFGSVRVKVVPAPGTLAAVMVPLWALTSSLAMERPSPFPLADREWSH